MSLASNFSAKFEQFIKDTLWDIAKVVGSSYRQVEDDSSMDCDQTEEIAKYLHYLLNVNEGNLDMREINEFWDRKGRENRGKNKEIT